MIDMRQWREVRVGVADGGLGHALLASPSVLIRKDFASGGGHLDRGLTAVPGHGDMVARLILQAVPRARLVVANIFEGHSSAAVRIVTEALHWLSDLNLDVVNLSFGTPEYSANLEAACRRMSSFGTLLICSSPARGRRVFPAAFDSCIAVTGDARCMAEDVSWLDTETADFGTHPFVAPNDFSLGGGASYAAARLTGVVADLIANGVPRECVVSTLRSNCRFFGPERRGHDAG